MRFFRLLVDYVLNWGCCLYLLTVGYLRRSSRETLYRLRVGLGWTEPKPVREPYLPPTLVPKISVAELLPTTSDVHVHHPVSSDGNVSTLELVTIAQLVCVHRPRTCFEIGTFNGRTTLNLAANLEADGDVYTLDLPREKLDQTQLPLADGDQRFIDKEESGVLFTNTPFASRIHQVFGDSATFDFGPYENRIDFVFVDGSHAYEYLKSDTEVALRLLRDGKGVILWHDYSSFHWRRLTEAMNELYEADPRLRGMRWIEGTTLLCLVKES